MYIENGDCNNCSRELYHIRALCQNQKAPLHRREQKQKPMPKTSRQQPKNVRYKLTMRRDGQRKFRNSLFCKLICFFIHRTSDMEERKIQLTRLLDHLFNDIS